MNLEYYENIKTTIEEIPVPDVKQLVALGEEKIAEAAEILTDRLKDLIPTSNSALKGVTQGICEKIALLEVLINPPTDIGEVIEYLTALVTLYLGPHAAMVAELVELAAVSVEIVVAFEEKATEIMDAFEEARALVPDEFPAGPAISPEGIIGAILPVLASLCDDD